MDTTQDPAPDSGVYTIESIEAAAAQWDRSSSDLQRKTVRFAIAATTLAPVAVVLLGIQVIVVHKSQPYAGMLIGLELALLALVLAMGYTGFGPDPREWAGARIRAEVLRREKFLLRVRLGPYLGLQEVSGEIRRRLLAVNMEETDPTDLLPLVDMRGHWRDQLEDAHHSRIPEQDLLACLRDYSENRINDQLKFYRNRTRRNRHRHEWLEACAKGALVLAMLASAAHLFFVLMPTPAATTAPASRDSSSDYAAWEQFFTIASLVLPPVIAAIAGWQSFYQANRLKLSYQNRAEALNSFAAELSRLEDKVVQNKPLDAAAEARLFRDFKRIVLRAEEIMAHEQMQWWMMINSWTPGV